MVPRNPAAGENGDRRPGEAVPEAEGEPVGRDVACAVFSLLVTAGVLAVLYPVVVSAGQPLGYLTSTAIVGTLVVVWLAVWTCVETVWTRRVGRPNGT